VIVTLDVPPSAAEKKKNFGLDLGSKIDSFLLFLPASLESGGAP